MITDYGTLTAGLVSRSHRVDLASLMPDFIRRAHDLIVGEVVMGADLDLSLDTVAVPTGFREAVSLWLVNRPWVQVTEASPFQMQTLTGSSGRPALFRIDGANLRFYPAPEQAYSAKLLYRLSRDFFAEDSDTNAILTRYPFVYLYGAMAEIGRHLIDDGMIGRYEPLFRSEVERINSVETGDVLRGPLQATSSTPW